MTGYNIKLPNITSYYDLVNQYQKRRNGLTGLAGINIGKPIYKPPTTSPTPSPGATLPGSSDQYVKLQANILSDFEVPSTKTYKDETSVDISNLTELPETVTGTTPTTDLTKRETGSVESKRSTTTIPPALLPNNIVGIFTSANTGQKAYLFDNGDIYLEGMGVLYRLEGNNIIKKSTGEVVAQLLPDGTYINRGGDQGSFTDLSKQEEIPEFNIPTDVYSTSTSSSSSGLPPQLLSQLASMIETLKPLAQKYTDYMNWLSSPGLFIDESKRMMKNILEPLYDTLAKRGLVDSSIKEEALEKAAEMIPQMYLAERMDIADLLRQAVALPFAGMGYGRESVAESLTEHPLQPYQLMAQMLLSS